MRTRYASIYFKKKENKYKNKKIYIDDIKFDSKAEAERYCYLKALMKAGEVISIKLQPEFELQPAFVKDGKKYRAIKYIADFQIMWKDEYVTIEDVKGVETKEFKLKRKLFEYKYPFLTLTIIK